MSVDFPSFRTKAIDGISLSREWTRFLRDLAEKVYALENSLMVPVMTETQRNALNSPENGRIIYNSTANKFQGRENGVWVNL